MWWRTALAGQVAEGISLRLGQVDRVFVLGDETQLTRVVSNLVDNAPRYAASVVELSVRQDGQQVVVSVSDDGPGIPAADRERIWERFARLDDDRSRSSGRSGLGPASGSPPASRTATYCATVFASHPASCAADQAVPVRSNASNISMISLPDLVMGPSRPLMGKANHLEPIHTGGTTSITTRHETGREQGSHPHCRWPRDWNSDGREPGAN